MTVTVIIRKGNKMFGYNLSTKRSKEKIQRDLEKEFGENIVLLKFKE